MVMATVVTTPKVGVLRGPGDRGLGSPASREFTRLWGIFRDFWGSEHGPVESLSTTVSGRVIVHDARSREFFGDVSQ